MGGIKGPAIKEKDNFLFNICFSDGESFAAINLEGRETFFAVSIFICIWSEGSAQGPPLWFRVKAGIHVTRQVDTDPDPVYRFRSKFRWLRTS